MSNVFGYGTAISIVEEFATVDPLTELSVAADPTTVTFTVEAPDASSVSYVFGVASEVTNPEVGTYVLRLVPPLQSGVYAYRVAGTGAVEAADEGTFTVTPSGVVAVPDGGVPTPGPCSPWIDGDYAAGCGPDLGVGSETWRLDDAAADGSALMFELSGRQFPGVCTRKVRPCREKCGCWSYYTGGSWSWMGSWSGGFNWGMGSWVNEEGGRCGCDRLSQVKLGGSPIREILEVKISGVVLPQYDDDGNLNWRIDRNKYLTRMDSPGPPRVRRLWPGCQNLSLADTEDGTFSISYTWGIDVPELGKQAAGQIARELWKACSGDKCALPSRVTKIVRQGVTMDRIALAADLLRGGGSGLPLVDAFIASSNPAKMRRKPAVWSPDVQKYARPEGR